jgi:hypothetical protein
MDVERVVTEVLTEQAEQRPDPQPVLAEVRRRVRRRRRVAVTRTGAALGAAAAVAAIATGVALGADRPDGRPSAPAGVGTSSPVATTPTAPDTPAPTAPRRSSTAQPNRSSVAPRDGQSGLVLPPGQRNYSTIAAGWLPGPARQVGAQNQPGFEERDYDVTVDGTHMDVIIWVERGPLPDRTEAGSHYRSITVNGHRAREFVDDIATIVAVDRGNGTIAFAGPSVTATTPRVTTERISAIARHVAGSIEFGRHDPIPR